jgi:hypothetical protein
VKQLKLAKQAYKASDQSDPGLVEYDPYLKPAQIS